MLTPHPPAVYSTNRSKAVVLEFTLCCFVVYSTRPFVISLALCYFALVFSVFLALRLIAWGRESLSLCFLYVSWICACLVLSVSFSSWCLGRAAVCDCGSPWFCLTYFFLFYEAICFVS